MKLALIGVGQAGGKIVDAFLRYDRGTESRIIRSVTVINTASVDLQSLASVPEEDRILVGQSRVSGHGVGADNELAATIFEEDIEEIQRSFDTIPAHDVDALLVVAALGGGTGSGGGPVIIRHLNELFTEPVYGLGVLPASDEGGIYSLNATRSLRTFVREADNLLLFDNDAWRDIDESLEGGYEAMNHELVRRLGVLFSAGDPYRTVVGESVVDASEIINTLAGGGISSIGYAAEQIDGNDGGLLPDLGDTEKPFEQTAVGTTRITGLIRKATLGRLTIPCSIRGTERALVVIAGPPDTLNRKGIEQARKWVEDETGSMEVRGGDFPLPNETKIAGVVVLSGVTKVPRIEQLQQQAASAKQTIDEADAKHDEHLTNLLNEDLDPLF